MQHATRALARVLFRVLQKTPTITVNAANDGSHAWVTIHDDGSVCSKVVTPVVPSYIPGSVVELHDKRTKIMHARPGVRRVGWRKGPKAGTI